MDNCIEHVLRVCEEGNSPTPFDIHVAKDELKCILGGLNYLRKENETLKSQLFSILSQLKNNGNQI